MEHNEKNRFRSFVEKSDSYCVFLYQIKPESKFLYVSPSVYEITGYRKDDFYSDPDIFVKLIHKEDFPVYEFKKLFPDLSEKPFIMRWIKKDGTTIWTKQHYKNIYDKKRDLKSIQIVVFDITEQKMSDFALIGSQRKFKELFDNANEFMFLADFSEKKSFGSILEVNNFSKKHLNIHDVSGMNFFNLISDSKILETRKAIEKVLQKKLNLFETIFIKGEEDSIFVDVNASYFKLGDKDVILFIAHDISERKKIEYNLQINQKLEAIGRLAGGIAHDFNNYLTAILGNISLIKISHSLDSEMLSSIIEIENVAYKAKKLTNQLLTFSIGGSPVKEVGNLYDLIKANLVFLLRGTNINFNINIADDLRLTEFDEGQMNQVINNLIINSMQVMIDGGEINITLENYDVIEQSFLCPGEYVKFTFSDTGPGIPDEYLNKIFEPFFTTKKDGHGLGLSTSYSIVRKHGGDMKVTSEINKGVTFTIFLPSTEKNCDNIKPNKSNQISKDNFKLLILEDNDDVIETLGNMLNKLGYRFKFTKRGEEAIDLYRKELIEGDPFDGVILDLTTQSGLEGKATIKELRKINPKITAIVSSSYSNDPIMSSYSIFGFSDVIIKPYDMEKISNVLYNLFGKR